MILGLIAKTFFLYIVVVVTMRVMGKRQIGQLQPFEFVVAMMISELAAIPLSEDDRKIHHALIPIGVLLASQLIMSYVSIKGVRIREIICGKPTLLIRHGKLLENNLKKEMYTINDLLEQLRFNSVQSIKDVEYALLETNGQLSVIVNSQKRPVTPEDLKIETKPESFSHDLIIDGKLIGRTLETLNLKREWVDQKLAEMGITDYSQVFYASIDKDNSILVQKRGEYLE